MTADASVAPLALRWMMLGEWRARPGRVLVAILAIAVGVALGLAVHLVNRSALDQFGRAVRSVNGDADLQVRAVGAAGFGEGLYPVLARTDAVAVASPVVELAATAGPNRVRLTLLGLDPLRAAGVTPTLLGRPRTSGASFGALALDEDAVFLSPSVLAAVGQVVGGRLELTAAGQTAAFVIAGTLDGVAEGQAVAVVDIAAAQWRFGQLGRLQRLDLKLASGADRDAVARQIAALLPPDAQVVTAQSQARRSDSLSRAYRVNLEMLAMVALLTGGFLVYSAQSLSVTRRRPQFALLRVLGLRRGGMLAQVLLEGLLLGVAGSALGLVLGTGLAALALRLLGGDLGGGFFGAETPGLAFAPLAAGVIFGLGLLVALGGSLVPALEAGRVQAAVALKAAPDSGDPRVAPKPWLALGLLAAGGLLALGPPLWGLPLLGYGSMALLLAGGVAAMPWLARQLLRPLRRLSRPPAVGMAVARLWGAPGQAGIALCGVVASTSLMIAMAVMVASFRGSVDEWLLQILPADLYLRLDGGEAAGLDPAAQRALAAAPGVVKVAFRRTLSLSLDPDRPPVALVVQAIDRVHPERNLPVIRASAGIAVGATPVWISEPMARVYGRKVGDRLRLPIGSGAGAPVVVAGVWRDYARQFGSIAMDAADYTRLTGDAARTEAAVTLQRGVSSATAAAALRAALPPDRRAEVSFADPKRLRVLALRIFDRSFAVTYALEAIAILVGLTGVAATFSAQTLARAKEFGMLRHVGVLRRQIVWMLATEGALLGLIGALAGCALGLAMSQVLIQVINPQSFNWTMQTRLPAPLFAILIVALTATAALAAMIAGRGALGEGPVRAVREDW